MSAFVSNLSSKINVLVSKSIYYSKVVGEVAKQVYVKEGLQPPAFADVKSVYSTLFAKAVYYSKNTAEFTPILKNLNKNNYITYGAIGVQLAGLFNLGEIIGRRHIVGYKSHHH